MHGMEIELVPDLGARLPRGGQPLAFGATEPGARHRLEWFGEVRPSFVCGATWNWRVRIGDRWVQASGGGDGLLDEIRIMRAIEYGPGEAAGIPVVYRGIDVFEHTMAEVEFLLGATPVGHPELRLTGVPGTAHAQAATLTDLSRRR